MASSSRQEQLFRWVQITFINGVGWLLSVLIVGLLVKNIDLLPDQIGLPLSIGVWLVVGCLTGYSLGILQIGPLMAYGFKSGRWPLTTMVGLGIAYSSYAYLVLSDSHIEPVAFSLVFSVLLGGLVGLLQWLVLRRQYSHAGWWMPVNIIVWMLGVISIFAIPVGSLRTASVIAASTITSVVLLWLLRHPVSPPTGEGP